MRARSDKKGRRGVERDKAIGRRGAAQKDVRVSMCGGGRKERIGSEVLRSIVSADVAQEQEKNGKGQSRPRSQQSVIITT